MWFLAFVLGGVVVCVSVGLRISSMTARDWDFMLLAPGMAAVDAANYEADVTAFLADDALGSALEARDSAEYAEAVRLVAIAVRVLDDALPARQKRLRALALCMRMAAVVVPLPPLWPGDFQTPSVWTLAGMGTLLHHLLVTTRERYWLRLRIIAWSYWLIVLASKSSADAIREDPRLARAWAKLLASAADWKTLDRETVASARALMVSVAALPR